MSTEDLEMHGNPDDGPLWMAQGIHRWLDPNHPEQLPTTVKLLRPRLQRHVFRRKPFMFTVRLQPPVERDLLDFSREVTALAKLPEGKNRPVEGDLALFLCGGIWAPTALVALRRNASYIVDVLGDVQVVAVSIKVWSP